MVSQMVSPPPHPIWTGQDPPSGLDRCSPPPPVGRQSSNASTCYASGGMPLAHTQEDFLVLINVKVSFCTVPVPNETKFDQLQINSSLNLCSLLYFETDKSYTIPVVCSVAGLFGILCILCVVMWHAHRTTSQQHPRPRRNRSIHETQPLEHKTNNDQDNGGRGKKYRNPLFEGGKPTEECNIEGHNNDSGGEGNRPTSTTELLEIDIEKYEKSPRTRHSSRDNDNKHNKPKIKTTKKKNINVEISRSKTYKCERDNFEDLDIIV